MTREEEIENKEHVIAVDANCSCGDEIKGAWSGSDIDTWHETHPKERRTDEPQV